MINLKKLTHCLLFLSLLLLPCPSFSADDKLPDGKPPFHFAKSDLIKDHDAIKGYLELRQIKEGDPINVLAIDGGGVRGIIPATFLEKLEAQTGIPVKDLFDFVVGTSTGGILALGLVTPITNQDSTPQFRTASDMVQVYTDLATVVFPLPGMFYSVSSWFSSYKYEPEPLEQQLAMILGTQTLRDLSTPTAITSVRSNDNSPYIFTTYRGAWDDTGNFFLKDIGRATSAAPTYFPMKQMTTVDGKSPLMSFTDGGLAANDPAAIALSEAYRLFGPRPVNLISLGTGFCPIFNDAPKDPIYLKQAVPVIDTLFSAQTNLVVQTLNGLDQPLGPLLTYRKAQISLPEKLMPMDEASNVCILRDMADRYFETDGKRTLDRISKLLVKALNKRGLSTPSKSIKQPENNAYFYKPSQEGTLTLDNLNLTPIVKILDLSNRSEVDDNFIKVLSENPHSENLIIIDLSGTKITPTSLQYILESPVLGTRRETPQINGNYGGGRMAYSEIYLNVQRTQISMEDVKPFKGFVADFTLNYSNPTDTQVGMKRLRFKK